MWTKFFEINNYVILIFNFSDRFVAKVVNVFERCADVILFWSPKRDIRDLKIKAYLRLVDSKRYSNGGRNRNSNRSNNFSVRNIEVSELIYVELDYISSDRKNIEVIRCKTLSPEADQTVDDNDVDELDEDRFKSKSLERTTFHDYMMDHDNLRNPYLTKQPPFTSLLYGSQFVDCYRRKLEQRKLTKRKSNESTNVKDDELVILNDTGKSSNQKAESRNEPFSDRSRRPTFSISSERTPNLKKSSLQSSSIIRVPSTSHSSSSLSDSDSSSSSSSSSSVSDSSRRHKRKRKKSKHHHRTSKKSKKSKKKKKLKKSSMKHNRSKDDDEKRHRNSKKKKIDHKILELLKMAK